MRAYSFSYLFLSMCALNLPSMSYGASFTKDDLEVASDALYSQPINQWPSTRITICWESDSTGDQSFRQIVRRRIKEEYETNLPFNLVGWNPCNNDKYSHQIRVGAYDPSPGRAPSSFVGQTGKDTPRQVKLNFEFNNWDPGCKSFFGLETCVLDTAVHEFGHILSAVHEQLRGDTNPDCTAWLKQNSSGPEAWQPTDDNGKSKIALSSKDWDLKSCMNYCNESGFSFNGNNYGYNYSLIHNNNGRLSSADLSNWQGLVGRWKLYYASGTAYGNYPPGVSFAFANTSGSAQYSMPDLYLIIFGIQSGSSKVEVHATTAASNYQNFSTHTATSMNIYADPAVYYGHTMVQRKVNSVPDLVFLTNNVNSGRLEVHTLQGSSNWQTFNLHTQLPISTSKNARITFGDYDGDGEQDLFVITNSDGAIPPELHVLQGPNWSKELLVQSLNGLSKDDHRNCQWTTGNFFNSTLTNPSSYVDLLCVLRENQSTNTFMTWNTFLGREGYKTFRNHGKTQFTAENGTYGNIGVWKKGPSSNAADNSSFFAGDGYGIMYARINTDTGITEAHALNPSLYF